MKKIFYTCITLLMLCMSLFSPISVQAVTLDNDGNAKDTPYGDSNLPNSFSSCDYYDCYVPYNLTPGDIGGYANGVIAYTYSTYNYSMTSAYPDRVNQKFANMVNGYQPMKSTYHGFPVTTESDTNLQIVTDANGGQYYMMAIQKFFYNFGGLSLDTSTFPDWNNNSGQLVDVILTDGTVVHFCIVDCNAEAHTNGGPVEKKLWNVQYRFADLKLSQYANLFHAAYGNTIEISGASSGAGVQEFRNKYGMSLDGNQIAYYRMYNAKIDSAPKRSETAGNGVSYNLGSVTVNSSSVATSSTSTLVSEWELVGMPKRSEITSSQRSITLPSKSNLTVGESYSVSLIKDNIEIANEASAFDKARIFLVFLGLVLVTYAMLLYISMIFDRVNTFMDFSLVKVITFGKLEYSPYEKDIGDGKGRANTTKLLISATVVLIVGLFLISGSILPIMSNIIYTFSQKFL